MPTATSLTTAIREPRGTRSSRNTGIRAVTASPKEGRDALCSPQAHPAHGAAKAPRAVWCARRIPACSDGTKPQKAGQTQVITQRHCRLRAAWTTTLRCGSGQRDMLDPPKGRNGRMSSQSYEFFNDIRHYPTLKLIDADRLMPSAFDLAGVLVAAF